MCEDTVQWPGHAAQIQRGDEQGREPCLSSVLGTEETPELLVFGAASPRGLLLKGAERAELTVRLDDPFDGRRTERPDQFVLQIRDADEEPEVLHVGAGEVRAEALTLERANEVALLGRVAEAGQPEVGSPGTEPPQEPSDVLRTPDRDDRDALGVEGATASLGERLERPLIADAFDEDDGMSLHLRCSVVVGAAGIEPATSRV